jgi:hypothetical protein
MLRWWRARRRREAMLEAALAAAAEAWIARHGPHARQLARMRSIDAYLLGDLAEQERWSRIREMIDEREGHDAFSTPSPPSRPGPARTPSEKL